MLSSVTPSPRLNTMAYSWTHRVNNFTLNTPFHWGDRIKTARIDFKSNYPFAQAKRAFHEKAAQ